MKQETKEQRQERKDMYVSRAVSMAFGADENQVIKEAGEKFEEANPVENF